MMRVDITEKLAREWKSGEVSFSRSMKQGLSVCLQYSKKRRMPNGLGCEGARQGAQENQITQDFEDLANNLAFTQNKTKPVIIWIGWEKNVTGEIGETDVATVRVGTGWVEDFSEGPSVVITVQSELKYVK